MFTLQASNYLIPLITFPYLIRTLGLESYGLMTFAQNIVSYGEQLISYGFVLTAPKDIAHIHKNRTEMSRLFFSIFYSRLLLMVISAVILTVLCALIPRFEEMQTVIFIGFSMLLALALQIDWFFQGIQQMKNITFVNVISRLLSLIFLFYWVKTPNDVGFAILSIALSQIIAYTFSWFLAFRYHGLQFVPPQYMAIKTQIQGGFQVFLSQFLVRFYSSDVNITVLGLVSNNLAVGTYQFAYRIYLLISAVATPVFGALYPYLANLFKENYPKFQRQVRQIAIFSVCGYLMAACILFFTADWLVLIISNKVNEQVSFTLRLLSLSVIIVPFGPLFTQMCLLYEKKYWLLWVCFIGIVLNFTSLLFFYTYFEQNALSITHVLVSWSLFIVQFISIQKLLRINVTI